MEKMNNKGISLVELIVAVTILAIAVAAFLQAFVISSNTNAKAKKQLQATDVAKNVMEQLDTINMETIVASPSQYIPVKTVGTKSYYALLNQTVDGRSYDVQIIVDRDNTLNLAPITSIDSIDSGTDATIVPSEHISEVLAKLELQGYEQKNVSRTVTITIDEDASNRTMVSYEYVYKSGGTTIESMTEGDLVFGSGESEGRALRTVYLFFYPWYTSVTGSQASSADTIVIDNRTGQRVTVVLAKQKDTTNVNLVTQEGAYIANVTVCEDMTGKAEASTGIRTNLDQNLADGSVTAAKAVYTLKTPAGEMAASKILRSDLVTPTVQDRVFGLTVEVYEQGAYQASTGFDGNKKIVELTGGMID